ncbi:MAG: class II glutamine amidotransferase [Bacteroidota bacterium]
MCRFVAYIGTPVLADDLLYKPKNSLVIAQTMNAGEMSVTVNGDGFGLGWYAPEIDNEPCVFRGIKPAWSDMNLRNISKKIVSPLIFGHIRAASPGMLVEEVNSHPFSHGKLMFMHNGMVGGFKSIRRQLLRELNDVAYDAVHGATDSEHMFGLFLNYIRDPFGPVTSEEMVEAMNKMFEHLNDLLMESNVQMHSYLNFVVTNGTSIIATRYTTNPSVQPATLYYMYGKQYTCEGDHCIMEPAFSKPTAIVIASEPFTARRSDWMKVERNAMMIVDETMKIRFQNIELPIEKMEFEAVQNI